jgi:pimeloyl-ACP methyl ester carboxylesterase
MLSRKAFLALAGTGIAAGSIDGMACASESDITLVTPTGRIAGTLTLAANSRSPVVLIVAGSGPTDRDGNSGLLRTDAYKLLAGALAARGIASVRYDKRGIGASASALSSESAVRFDDYVDDAVAWLDVLRADRRFSNVVLAGHSEGSLIGILAAKRTRIHAFVSLEGAGRPAYVVIREQLKPKVPAALYAQADEALQQLQSGKTVANPPPELAALFRPSIQPYLISWFKYDPAVEIAGVPGTVAIVQGTADVQVTLADAKALAAAHPTAQLVIVNGMNHVLKYAPDVSSEDAILKGYQDFTLPLAPQVVTTIASIST